MHTMHSMVQDKNMSGLSSQIADFEKGMDSDMEEKVYKTMGRSGALSIAVGVVSIVTGLAGGVLLIVSGARLLSRRTKILF